MKQCPSCKRYTLSFDKYFSRYRCYNPQCNWMPPTSTQMALTKLHSPERIKLLESAEISELEITLTSYYDEENDAFICDFGSPEPAFDLPEDDGIMLWKYGQQSKQIIGFVLAGAKAFGISELQVNFEARKKIIESHIPSNVSFSRGNVGNNVLIEKIFVSANMEPHRQSNDDRIGNRISELLETCSQ